MSGPCDSPADMGDGRRLDDRLAEDLLRGRTDAVPEELRATAEVLGRLRSTTASAPQPSAELARVFAEGLGPDAVETAPLPALAGASQTSVIQRGRTAMRTFITRAAGLSLVAKLTIGTTVAAAAVGAGAAGGGLPGGDVPAAERAEFGQQVAEDATDEEEAGVDGWEVSQNAQRRAEERRAERGEGDDNAGEDNASERGQQARELKGENASQNGQDAREAGADNAQRGLDEANSRSEGRAPETAPQSGEDGREHARQRVNDAPAPQERPVDPPAGPETGEDQRSTGSQQAPEDGEEFGQDQAEERSGGAAIR